MDDGREDDGVDVEVLVSELEAFGGSEAERRAVARQARDLADSGRYEEDADVELTVDFVVSELEDAPDGGPADRWNWWLGALELAFGGYAQFQVRRWSE